MTRWDRWSPYPKPAPKRPPPARGIKVKRIGTTWWGQRWIDALERLSLNYSNRLVRGRTYARAGRVHDLDVASGKVTARVTGSRATPYKVTLRIAPLDASAWERAIGEMARAAVFAADLLAGEMPKEIDNAFRSAGRSLFPATEKELETDCSCPDWANPCKHVAATHYVLGEALDKDPFLLFELRGRGKEDVLGALRRHRTGTAAAAEGAQSLLEDPGSIPTVSIAKHDPAAYERRCPTVDLRLRIEAPASPAAVLHQLGALPSWSLDETAAEVLAPIYQAAGALARDLALRPAGEGGLDIAIETPAAGPRPVSVETEAKLARTTTRRTAKAKHARSVIDARKLDLLIEEAVVDAYNESEQRTALYTMIDENLKLPFKTEVLGIEVSVERVELNDAEEIVAICKRARMRQVIPILDLPLPTPLPAGAEWIEAYRRWVRQGGTGT